MEKYEEYSEEKLQEITNKVSRWIEDFKKSPGYLGLSQSQQDEAGFIIATFAELMYNYYELKPEKWNGKSLEECCIDLFPRKISAGIEFYEAVEPVLTTFFEFMQYNRLITNAKQLTIQLKKVSPQMIAIANNPANWGPAKQIMLGAFEEGIDPTDQEAINQYMMTYNQKMIQNRNNNSIRTVTKVGRNEPCPCGSGKKYKKCCGGAK